MIFRGRRELGDVTAGQESLDSPMHTFSHKRNERTGKYLPEPLEVRLQRSIMTVSLNPKGLKAFTISGPTFIAIGIVRWEQEFGLLTIDPNGDYVRVNGSYKELLDPEDVRAAIFRASQNWNMSPNGEFQRQRGSTARHDMKDHKINSAFRLGMSEMPTAQAFKRLRQHNMFAASASVYVRTATSCICSYL